MGLMNGAQMGLLNSLRTGNTIVDMLIGLVVTYLFTWILSLFGNLNWVSLLDKFGSDKYETRIIQVQVATLYICYFMAVI